MRTIRRFYFYLVAFISLEVILWSVITLTRTLFDASTLTNIGEQISGGLAFLIVGLPIFLFHWLIVQRDAYKDTEERGSRLRELFLYGTYLATLIPIAQNVIAIINRLFLLLFRLDTTSAFLGSEQSLQDNLVALLVMGVAFYYFYTITRQEWNGNIPESSLPETRRLFRYIWMLYSLVLLILGTNSMLQYIFLSPSSLGNPSSVLLVNGLAITLVSAPLWAYNWLTIQRSLPEPGERGSTLRLVVLYLLALAGIITTLFSAGWVIAEVIRPILLQEIISAADLLNDISSTLSIAIPAGIIWAFFGREWNLEINQETNLLRRAALRRLYFYILALLGNISVFAGFQMVLGVVIDISIGQATWLGSNADSLSAALAMLAVGLQVWLRFWPGLQTESARLDETGDHARRSIIRKSYLYLAIFALVVGLMSTAGLLLYHLFGKIFIGSTDITLVEIAQDIKALLVVLVWLGYHFLSLRGDGKAAQAALETQHAAFPVVFVSAGNLDYFETILENLRRSAPAIPCKIMEQTGLDREKINQYKAIVIPVTLITETENQLSAKIEAFEGTRIILPEERKGWYWQGLPFRSQSDSAKETARVIRLLAENQTIHPAATNNPWILIGYIFGALFGLQVLMILFGLIMAAFGGF